MFGQNRFRAVGCGKGVTVRWQGPALGSGCFDAFQVVVQCFLLPLCFRLAVCMREALTPP